MKVISQYQSNGLHENIATTLYPTHQLICSKLIVAIEELFIQPSRENDLPFWDDCKGIIRYHAVISNGSYVSESAPLPTYPGDDKIIENTIYEVKRIFPNHANERLVWRRFPSFEHYNADFSRSFGINEDYLATIYPEYVPIDTTETVDNIVWKVSVRLGAESI